MIQKPPLGLIPRKTFENGRVLDILAAMSRYVHACIEVPSEWQDELDEILERWRELKKEPSE